MEEDCDLSALRERLEENRQRYAYDLNYQWYKPIPIQRPQTKRRRMDAISRQAQLICREKLDTGEDVQTFIDERKSELERLQTARQKCYNRLRRCKDGVEIAAIKIERDRLTAAMVVCRKEIKAADEVLAGVTG